MILLIPTNGDWTSFSIWMLKEYGNLSGLNFQIQTTGSINNWRLKVGWYHKSCNIKDGNDSGTNLFLNATCNFSLEGNLETLHVRKGI